MKILGEAKPLEYYLGKNYPVTLHRAEEGGFAAEIEDLQGCFTQGETIEEVIENIEEARQLWINAAYEDGVEIPIPRTDEEYSGKFLTRITKSLHRRLAEQARYEGVSLNLYVESILSSGVSTQNTIEKLSAELDKISEQISAHRSFAVSHTITRLDVKWGIGEIDRQFREIKDKEQVAA